MSTPCTNINPIVKKWDGKGLLYGRIKGTELFCRERQAQ
jgi:hypothetical protein